MGIILAFGMFTGLVIGLGVTILLIPAGILLTLVNAKRKQFPWHFFMISTPLLLALFILVVYFFPFQPVRPGSDYNIVMKNFFFSFLGYSAAPGLAFLLGGISSFFAPNKEVGESPETIPEESEKLEGTEAVSEEPEGSDNQAGSEEESVN